jgi:CHAD domain-containing protein
VSEEVELKYDVEDLDAMAHSMDEWFPPSEGAGWQATTLTDRAFDTADFDLARAGFGARLRTTDGTTVVGLKSTIEVAGAMHRRREIEGPASERLHLFTWPASDARQLVASLAAGKELVERFHLRQHRRERAIELPDGSAWISLDDAQVLTAGGQEIGRLRGLEVELRDGRRRLLGRLAGRIQQSGLASPQPLSKMQLGHGLVAARAPLSADELLTEAGRKVLARHLARMLEREASTRAGDELALKQMRVATRRMRSVWQVFDGAYRRAEQRRYLAELRALARLLGAVRDLDVLLGSLPKDEALAPLADSWRGERATAMRRLLRHLDSPAHGRFTNDYRRFVGSPTMGAARRARTARVGDEAAERISAAYLGLRQAGAFADEADVETLHALRITSKRLRYTLETFREVLPEEPLGRCLARLVGFQDALGEINDAAVAAARAEAWLERDGARAEQRSLEAVAAHAAGRRRLIEVRASDFARLWRGGAAASLGPDMELLSRPSVFLGPS